MSRIFFEEMKIPKPDIHLDIKAKFHTEKIGKMLTSLKNVLSNKNFSGVIVFGDINSTLVGAIAAIKNGHKLIHIEAGLRSYDRRMPEEINRTIVDHLSDVLFITEPSARENLLKEGVSDDKIKYVGNIMINSMEIFKNKINKSDVLNKYALKSKEYFLATIHRQENTDNPIILKKILVLLNEINKIYPIILPLHPGTKHKINDYKFSFLLDNIQIIEPLGYFQFMKLLASSKGVITDSGGIQEETSHLGVPCATIRDNTERPITLEIGSNKLFPLNNYLASKDILKHLLKNNFKSKHIPLWDSKVASRIFKNL